MPGPVDGRRVSRRWMEHPHWGISLLRWRALRIRRRRQAMEAVARGGRRLSWPSTSTRWRIFQSQRLLRITSSQLSRTWGTGASPWSSSDPSKPTSLSSTKWASLRSRWMQGVRHSSWSSLGMGWKLTGGDSWCHRGFPARIWHRSGQWKKSVWSSRSCGSSSASVLHAGASARSASGCFFSTAATTTPSSCPEHRLSRACHRLLQACRTRPPASRFSRQRPARTAPRQGGRGEASWRCSRAKCSRPAARRGASSTRSSR
mmetsp:Transcript_4374/g.10534  ORF Transcript_4374/g.10534 Transcript_4374/m.10534 type:complete len:260 (-) Transcript_4374:133-912(-)